jgi:hypothetical protein
MDGNGAGAMSFFLASTLEDGSVGFSTRRLVGRLDMPRHFPLSSIADEAPTNPLLKFHGCFLREPEETLWTQAQLHEEPIRGRVQSCSAWMGSTCLPRICSSSDFRLIGVVANVPTQCLPRG